MINIISSWLSSSSTPPTIMSKNASDEASDQTKLGIRESRREMTGDDASGGKDMTRDGQGSSQAGKHGEGSKLRRTTPCMIITKPQTSHTRGRHAPDPSNIKDSELAASTQRGADYLVQDRNHSEMVRDRAQKELGYPRTEKGEMRIAKNTGLLAAQAEVDDLRKKLEASERQRNWLSKILEDERRDKRDLKAPELDLAQKEVHALRQKLEKIEKESNWYVTHYERQKQELQTIREQLQRAEIVHERTREQLMKRTAELQNAQLFIDVTDPLSGADIISMTAALNAEILQSAALMADYLDYAETQREVPNEVLLNVRETIGENLTKALVDQRLVGGKDIDPTLVQLALQVCLVHCSKAIITSWTLEGNDDRLSKIYSKIWNEEKQSVAGRWRSMTQMHAAAADGPHLALQMIIGTVKRVLIVTRTDYHPFVDRFQEWLSTINTLSLHLRSSIGLITSMEIHPFTIESGIAFNPSEMDNTYAEGKRSDSMAVEASGRVAGSTELGLISQVKEDIKGKVETKVMLKPKVVLCSALTESG